MPPTIDEWIPENHLARFVVEIVEKLDLKSFENAYRGTGTEAYHPSILLELLFYGYSTGIFSSRKIEQATYDSVPFRYISRGYHPDHDTIATFRKRFLVEIEGVFKQILLIAHELGQLKMGTVSLDGTKIKANASKHKALSWEYANKLEAQVKDEIAKLMELAAVAELSEAPPTLNISDELTRRTDRLAKIATAKAEIEARAKARYDDEKKDYDEKIAARQEIKTKTGKNAKGRVPVAPQEGPRAKDQVNLTDEESRIMPGKAGGFEQAYNAQAAVDIKSMIIVENHISQCSNDKKEVVPALKKMEQLPQELGKVDQALLDSGYFSKTNVDAIEKEGIAPYIAHKRDPHNTFFKEHIGSKELPSEPATNDEPLTAVEQMGLRMKTPEGKKLYAQRKSTIEPVFGIVKHVMGFRQFLLRGIVNVSGEWNLVCTAFNIKRLHRCTVAS
jgi:transposase/IS5 family transposase